MAKHTFEEKLEIVSQVESGKPILRISRELRISKVMILEWVRKYNLYGERGLLKQPNVRATADFKEEIVRTILEKEVPLVQVVLQYGVSRSALESWVKLVRVHGYAVLHQQKNRVVPPNEYEVIYVGGQIQSVKYISDKGGDKTDYITVIDLDKVFRDGGITQWEMDVDVEYTSGIGTNYSQQESPTPGERSIHATTYSEFRAVENLIDLFSGGTKTTVSHTLKQVAKAGTKRVASATLRKQWEKANNDSWPKEPDFLQDGRSNEKYAGRNQGVSHRKALKDGGSNDLDNILPQPWLLHQETHKLKGDFKRWAKEINKKRKQ